MRKIVAFSIKYTKPSTMHEAVNIETVHQTADAAARRLVAIESTPAIGYWGSVEMEIQVEEGLIGYWRMLAREAIEYPEEFDHLVHSRLSLAAERHRHPDLYQEVGRIYYWDEDPADYSFIPSNVVVLANP